MDVLEQIENSKIRQALSRYFKICSTDADINLCADASNELAEIEDLTKQGKQMKWRDILSAPKDGTKILLIGTIFNVYPPNPFQVVGWFSRGWWTYNSVTLSQVNYWMPLPPNPKEDE